TLQVLQSGKPYQVRVDDPNANHSECDFLRKIKAKTIYILPLAAQERTIGVIEVFDKQLSRTFSDEYAAPIKLLANHAGIVIERAQLLKDTEQRAAELEALRLASLSLTASLDLQDVLRAILVSTMGLLKDALDTHIFLYDGAQLTFGASLWADGREDEVWANPRPGGLTYTVAQTGEAIVIPDIQTHPLYAEAPKEWSGAIIGVPLQIGQRVVGVMNIAYQQPRNFSKDELRVISLLADQAAITIENARLHNLVSQQALTDPLTGLPNRRAFNQYLEDEIRRSIRYQHRFALIMLDFDGFKRVNDTFGHPVGDRTLRRVGICMRSAIRDTDFLARLGGDEFALILPETEIEDASKICQNLKHSISECTLEWKIGQDHSLSLSFGIAKFPLDATNREDLISVADANLYRTKRDSAR
ncbi:MAG: sensor domain-containing diguanylate cyclase, partial [Anaerolineae bacterium]|nr:sensor domain-containing diguanylate cyclase [Anaerolineae bacterium]